MWKRGLSERERVARLLGGGIITGIALTGGYRNKIGRMIITSVAVASVFEGIVNSHLMEYFHLHPRK